MPVFIRNSSVVRSSFLSFSRGKARRRRRDFESTFSLILSMRSNLFRRISHLINAIVGEESPEKGAEGENDDPVDVAQTPPEGLLRCQLWHGRRVHVVRIFHAADPRED